jgi:hypothetical protein
MRNVSAIAYEIQREWGVKVNYAAKPYLDAMKGLDSVNESYGFDSGRSVVIYFLANASSFKGEKAKTLKQELKDMLKG